MKLSLAPIEAAVVSRAIDALPEETRTHLRTRIAEETCSLLDESGRCAIYESRPLVCRTQGIALRYPSGWIPEGALRKATQKGDVTWCPLNFDDDAPDLDDALDAERVDMMLALVDHRYCQAHGIEPGMRQPIDQLLRVGSAERRENGTSCGSVPPSMNVDSEPNLSICRAETELDAGRKIAVEVSGTADAAAWASAGLKGATSALVASGLASGAVAPGPERFGLLVGGSAPMRDLYRMLDRIRGSNATVLITGENGTGKELVAKTIHEQSDRKDQKFIATNCSAFNDNLLESELFGHKRGAFTGAVADKPGLFQVADHGTFFLDEVGDMSPALQVKVLRVLQEGTFTPVGAVETKKVDVRIIAATNRDLGKMVGDGTFREDLYYRLHVVALKVPALRERREDIRSLAVYFLGRLAERDGRAKTLTHRVMERLLTHNWPGNVRELENEIERMWVLSGNETVIDDEYLTATVGRGTLPPTAPNGEPERIDYTGKTLPEAVEELERRMILNSLEQAQGNRTRAAELLGISRRNLIRKVQAYGLEAAGRDSKVDL